MYKKNIYLKCEEISSQLKSKLGGCILFLSLYILLLFSLLLRNIEIFIQESTSVPGTWLKQLLAQDASETCKTFPSSPRSDWRSGFLCTSKLICPTSLWLLPLSILVFLTSFLCLTFPVFFLSLAEFLNLNSLLSINYLDKLYIICRP